MIDLLDAIQWPAMAVSVGGSWLVGSTHRGRRRVGFWLFIASNVLWVAWGWQGGAPALIVLQACLAVMNVRGLLKARIPTAPDQEPPASAAGTDPRAERPSGEWRLPSRASPLNPNPRS